MDLSLIVIDQMRMKLYDKGVIPASPATSHDTRQPPPLCHDSDITTVNSGKVLINSRIKHECSDSELLSRPSGEPLSDREKAVGLRTLWSVYGSDRSKCTGLCDVHEVARQLRNAGMTLETLILVWHVSYMDLTL
jgi:hypothetical protein